MQATEPSTPATRAPFSRDPRLRYFVPAIVLIVTAAVYLPALSFGFVCDDGEQIVTSQPRYVWSALPSYFTTDVWSYTAFVKSNYYRPGFLVWLLVNSRLFALDTTLWHAAAILLHLAAVLLFYFLARRLTGDRMVAGAAALLFGLHPVHIEAVAWLSGATEPLFAVLAFSAFLFQLRGRRIAVWLLFAASMFSKETSIVLPIMLAACEWMFPPDPSASPRQRLRFAAITLAVCACIVLIYAGMRVHALGAFAPLLRAWTPRMLAATIPSVAVFYLRQLFVPFQYSLMYAFLPVNTFGWHQTILPLFLLAAAGLLLLWLARQSRVFAFAALLLVLPILPVLNFAAFAFDDFVHDRYLYLPSAGLCLLLAAAGARYLRPAALSVALLACACGYLAYVNVQSSAVWVDDLTLYTHAADVAPESDLVAEYLGEALIGQQRFGDALPLFKRVLLRDSRLSVYENVAMCYLGLQNFEQATAYLQQAMSVFPHADAPHYYMAQVYMFQNQWPQAEAEARESIRLEPDASPVLAKYHGRLAEILEKENNYPAARAEFQTELKQNSSSEDAREGIQRLESQMKSGQTP